MYLCRLILNPRNSGVRNDLAAPYELHRTLMRGIDGQSAAGRLLYRIEPERGPGGPIVLVQAAVPPDWQGLLENKYLLRAKGPKPFRPELKSGQALRFRLMANPVKKLHGRRIPLTRDVARHANEKTYWDWLHRRAALAGFEVLHAHDTVSRNGSQHRKEYAKHEIPHFGVRFDGILRVTDAVRLLKAIQEGVGPAKAFGFGLLSLAPL